MNLKKSYLGLFEVYKIESYRADSTRTPLTETLASGAPGGPDQGDPGPPKGDNFQSKLLKILPTETGALYAFSSGTLIVGPEDTFGNVFTFVCCILVTGFLRLPLLLQPSGQKQVFYYFFHLLVCSLWLYATGCYLLDFHPKDDATAAVLMMVAGIFFAARYGRK